MQSDNHPTPSQAPTGSPKAFYVCSICGRDIEPDPVSGWDRGNNAQPINNGQCCNTCNALAVYPLRIYLSGADVQERIADYYRRRDDSRKNANASWRKEGSSFYGPGGNERFALESATPDDPTLPLPYGE